MGGWRRQRDLDDQSRRSFARKPPNQFCQPTVPSWEKKFCSTVGSVPWGKLLDTKKYMHLYANVVQWNDSAGEEAFLKAKRRFWAQINGLPCDISLPDPNENIDEVDWESQIDPELILDLDRGPEVVEEQDGCGKANLLLFYDQSAPVVGWGDVEEDLQKEGTGWGDAKVDLQKKGTWDENCWGSNNQNNWNMNDNNIGGNWDKWEPSNQKRDDAYTVGYKVSSFHGNNDKQRDRGGWRNEGRGIRRDSFAY